MSDRVEIVLVSSTALDLPGYREKVMDACLRMGMFPKMMEHLPALDADAIQASLDLVDQAEVYIGIFANRYGEVPAQNNPLQISITEMEYNRATERGIPRLIFLMEKNQAHVGKVPFAAKLEAFKNRLRTERVRDTFTTKEDLWGKVIQALVPYRNSNLTAFDYVSYIPQPPEPYIAHPYTLLQTKQVIGRQMELNLLTEWVTKPNTELGQARTFNLVAIGGMGKSALTWKWFNDIAPAVMQPLAGMMWWSFYESDASFENFIIRALAYVSRKPREAIQNLPATDREFQLLSFLDHQPFLIVLDGLERLLIAYSRMDAARLADDDLDERTANKEVAAAAVISENAAQSLVGKRNLRKFTDLRAGNFLKKMTKVRATHTLISTRLYPAELQTSSGTEISGSKAHFLTGLLSRDALTLWQSIGVQGSAVELFPLFDRFDNHPLLIQALAYEVANYRRAPGNFDKWRKEHPDFNPFRLPLEQSKSHVLAFALGGLDETAREVLHTTAAFRMSVSYDTIAALLVGDGKCCWSETGLITALTNLEDRGLLGWDKRANRYDLHPIVRGVSWSELKDDTKLKVYESLQRHFEALPSLDQYQVRTAEELTTGIELFNALVGLMRYDDAYELFVDRLNDGALDKIGSGRFIELLEMFFPGSPNESPKLSEHQDQIGLLNFLANAYRMNGRPRRTKEIGRLQIVIGERHDDRKAVIFGLSSVLRAAYLAGDLLESEAAGRRAIFHARKQNDDLREIGILHFLGLTLGARGAVDCAEAALKRAVRMAKNSNETALQFLAQLSLWKSEPITSRELEERAWEIMNKREPYDQSEERFSRGSCLRGEAALGLGELDSAEESLNEALVQARGLNLAEAELPPQIALAELRRRRGDFKGACDFLEEVWEPCERGPYPLFHADACNVLVKIERDTGNRDGAVAAANKAYRSAWCDGPPFVYHWGLDTAREYLKDLGAPEPEMPSFNESELNSVPEIAIDPPDGFSLCPS